MAIIPQRQLFRWKEVDKLGDLRCLLLVINSLPDEKLMKKMERERGKGQRRLSDPCSLEFYPGGNSLSAHIH